MMRLTHFPVLLQRKQILNMYTSITTRDCGQTGRKYVLQLYTLYNIHA